MTEKKQKTHWLLVIITILVFLVGLETLFLIQVYRKNKTVESAMHKYQNAVNAAQKHFTQAVNKGFAPLRLGGSPAQVGAAWSSDPFQEIQRLKEEMERLRGNMMARPVMYTPTLPSNPSFLPSVDFEETDTELAIHFDVPGLDKEKIKVRVENGMLTVEGERRSEKKTGDEEKGFSSSEIQYGSFARSISLPPFVDEGKVTASYEKGVLTVKFGKKTGEGSQASQSVPVV